MSRPAARGPLAGLLVADFSRILAGPYATDAAGRPRRRRGQGRGPARRRHPLLAAAGARRRLDVLPRRQPQQAVGRPRPQGPRRPRPRPGAGPARRHRDRELPARRPRAVRARLRHGRRGEPGRRLRLDQRLRQRRAGPGAARLRPDRAGDLRPDEPDRQPRHGPVPRRHLGLRRDGRAARDHRHPRRRCTVATRPAAASTSRSTCSSSALSGMVNHTSAYVAGGVVPVPHGQQPPRACSPTSRCRAPTAS